MSDTSSSSSSSSSESDHDSDTENDDNDDDENDLIHNNDDSNNNGGDYSENDDDENDDNEQPNNDEDTKDDMNENEDDDAIEEDHTNHENVSLQDEVFENDTSDPDDDARLDAAFLSTSQVSPVSSLSICSMSTATRNSLENNFNNCTFDSNSQASLEWDNERSLTTLSDPLDNVDLYSPTPNSSSEEEVFTNQTATSTPNSKRVTRSMTLSGEYEATMSPIPHRFHRSSLWRQGQRRLRRPRVRFTDSVSPIQDDAAIRDPAAPGPGQGQ